MRIPNSILIAVIVVSSLGAPQVTRAIENDPQKSYTLNEKHGPWMVMVGSFSDVQGDRKKKGLNAEQAASELVHELRGKGIPAYSFSQDFKKGKIETYDRLGNKDQRVFAAQHEMICVLAGNYEKIDDQIAQKTLAYVKRLNPKFMANPESGAVVRQGAGPFAGAFLTINPMRAPGEIARKRPDNETKYLNNGIDFALVNLKQKYTLKVATFTGKSAVPVGSSRFAGREMNFEKSIFEPGPYNLTRAGEDAMQLTYVLRKNSDATHPLGRDRFESYIYHDKFQSYVTVGGFDSKDDPEIRQLGEIFRGKYKRDPTSGEYLLQAESVSLQNRNISLPPVQVWAFDPVPELIEVPKIK